MRAIERWARSDTPWARTRQGTVRAIELFCRDRGFFVATDFSQWLIAHCVVHYSWTLFTPGFQILVSSPMGPKIVKKKKKTLVDLGPHIGLVVKG